jgi:kynurenine formamidase
MFQNSYRIIDITRRLMPGQPTNSYGWCRRLELAPIRFPNQSNQIAHDVTLMSHVGTHIESPMHMGHGGSDIADFPAEIFLGPAVLAEVTHRAPRGSVTAADLQAATGGRLQPGDCLLVWGRYAPEDRPRIALDAAHWIVAQGVKLLGFDSVDGIDDDAHDVILGNNIPMLEEIINLAEVRRPRVFLVALPLPIVGLDSCPVRAVLLEEATDAQD